MSTISEKLAQTVAQKERIASEVNTQSDLINQIKEALEQSVEKQTEIWTITLTDGSIIEKEIVLL